MEREFNTKKSLALALSIIAFTGLLRLAIYTISRGGVMNALLVAVAGGSVVSLVVTLRLLTSGVMLDHLSKRSIRVSVILAFISSIVLGVVSYFMRHYL